ncbi:related to Exportin-T [Saccharomycodes ludwigii]|uniref:Exportin-T n=1 Tax=Saccharomycodes ludwigii TaxID=36035 RepID=A0A376B9X2_9ASCO|nr:hypothetical protein SCDLUD_000416 [Saccharomycodes ludwigii]KAH3902824.1 hypothetical protein SCDLUD_000416 [Saccharomycodes ludwigii]SSD61488.1 related to Exportin-T [Saccharomycodes ludwigii]
MTTEQTLQQITQAIDVANSPTSNTEFKREAVEYLNQVKNLPNSAEIFADLIANDNSLYKFVALQTLSEIIPTAAANNSLEILNFIKTNILGYLGKNIQDPEFIRNKVAELLSLLFYFMYGEVNSNAWSTFFVDLIQSFNISDAISGNIVSGKLQNSLGVDYFLRTSLQINTEIADQTFVRNKDIQLKNNLLKDSMRVNDVTILSTLWFNILSKCSVNYQDLTFLTLKSIGSFVSWIDINLIVTNDFITAITRCLDKESTSIPCGDCLCEIISKKMKAQDKLHLLAMLDLTNRVGKFNNTDVEVIENLAKLVSVVGVEYTIIIDHDNNLIEQADLQITTKICPLVLEFLSHEYDNVSQQCFPFVTAYLSFLKKFFALGGKPGSAISMNSKKLAIDQTHLDFLEKLLTIINLKMKIDSASEPGSIDEIEEFDETIRSKLKVFQDTIAVINPTLYMQFMTRIIEQPPVDNDWRTKELHIFQMHNFAESVRNNLFGIPKNLIGESEPYRLMKRFASNNLLQDTSVFQFNNPWIQISFFELIVRHYNFIDVENELPLLNVFVSTFGIFSSAERVRLRTWYLFSRFVKLTKPKLGASDLLALLDKISSLLIISMPQVNSPTLNINNDSAIESDTTFDNQLYLFESVGILIAGNKKQNYNMLDGIMSPLFHNLEHCISVPTKTQQLVLQTNHVLMAIGIVARGIHSGIVPESQLNTVAVNEKLVDKTLIEKFSNIAEVVLVTFQYFNKYEIVRDSARFAFARLVPILNSNIIPYISRLLAIFYESDLKVLEMNDFLGFVGQIIHNFQNNNNCYQLLNSLVTPLVKKVFQTMNIIDKEQMEPTNLSSAASGRTSNGKNVIVTDAFREKILLKKAYYGFLQAFITNHVTSLFLTESNREVFALILEDLLTYEPQELQEMSTMKLSLSVLLKILRFLGTGACTDLQDNNRNDLVRLDGLREFFIAKIVPLCFEIPFKPEYAFNINDGSCRVIASDLARLLKSLYTINNSANTIGAINNENVNNNDTNGADGSSSILGTNKCIVYLVDVYFPQIQFPNNISMEFINALISLDEKKFEKYYVSFIVQIAS